MLLPRLRGLVVERVENAGVGVTIFAQSGPAGRPCRACVVWSERVHSRYVRRVPDGVIGGRPVVIMLTVRRFCCRNSDCASATFAEQVDGLVERHRRRSAPVAAMLAQVGLALAGRAGARLAAHLGISVGRTTLLRLVRALPEPELTEAPTVLGVGDFALREGNAYGTVLVDIDTGKAIDLPDGSEAEPLARWLRCHSGAEAICRDRAVAYAEGARTGAPDAIRVADRFRLRRNLGDHVEKAAARHRGCFKSEPLEDDALSVDSAEEIPDEDVPRPAESRLVTRTRERYASVQDLRRQGESLSAIRRILSSDRKTVRRFARSATVDELLSKAIGRSNLLGPCRPAPGRGHYRRRTTRHRDLRAGVRRQRPDRPPLPAPPSARCSPRRLLRRPCPQSAKPRDGCSAARTISTPTSSVNSPTSDPAVRTRTASRNTARHSPPLRGQREGEKLGTWLSTVESDDQPELHSFAVGIRRDHAAVTAGPTPPCSSGKVEGNVPESRPSSARCTAARSSTSSAHELILA
ncbi:ISL3 family transposase [Amycolatopsis sp. NPDC059090]|uniref:ISL3 family transposase n=1 Tax=Amycolatopsis sp. NPDC059090 TaxID=3346723 RepID=UPI00366CD830